MCAKVYVWWMPCTQKRHKHQQQHAFGFIFFKPPHGSWQRWLLFTRCSWCLYPCALSVMLLCVHTCGCGGKLPAHVLFFPYKNVTCNILSFLVTFLFFFPFLLHFNENLVKVRQRLGTDGLVRVTTTQVSSWGEPRPLCCYLSNFYPLCVLTNIVKHIIRQSEQCVLLKQRSSCPLTGSCKHCKVSR